MSAWLALISGAPKPEESRLHFSYPDVGALLPVAVLCAISILFTALWALAVWEYLRLRELSKDEQFAEHIEVQDLLAEAGGLIEGKKP
jgi:hypothetical protein